MTRTDQRLMTNVCRGVVWDESLGCPESLDLVAPVGRSSEIIALWKIDGAARSKPH